MTHPLRGWPRAVIASLPPGHLFHGAFVLEPDYDLTTPTSYSHWWEAAWIVGIVIVVILFTSYLPRVRWDS